MVFSLAMQFAHARRVHGQTVCEPKKRRARLAIGEGSGEDAGLVVSNGVTHLFFSCLVHGEGVRLCVCPDIARSQVHGDSSENKAQGIGAHTNGVDWGRRTWCASG